MSDLNPILIRPLRTEPFPARPIPAARPATDGPELDPLLVTPLRRPARRIREREKRDNRARPIMLNTALGIVVVTLLVTSAGRIVSFAVQPVVSTYQTGREIRETEGLLRREEAVNAALKRDIADLKARIGVEQEARRRGWVRPGEVALSVVLPRNYPDTPAETPVEKPAARMSVADRIRSTVDTCLAVLGVHGPGR